MAQQGFSPVYGARPLKRVLQKQILDKLAISLLEGGFVAGEHIVIDYENDRVTFRKG
jgi:ATP-dependent Clp protease ATP-binding subunit ClpB